MDAQQQRQQIYVDRAVQGGIVARLVLLWLASTALAAAVWFVMRYFADPTAGFNNYLDDAWQQIFPLVLAFGVTLPIAVLYLLRFTHRFAGPIVRLRNVLRDLASGEEVETLKFRDNDYWQDLADEFNNVAEVVREARRRVVELESRQSDIDMTSCLPISGELEEPATL